ncbi:hypothetical protein H4R27_002380 [Coemansia aciculifera]|nr:hypothetical protein H4R27_002380 [Coemansia aciculifera]
MTLSKTKARQSRSAPDTTDSAVASAPDPDSAVAAAAANSSPIDTDIASAVASKKRTDILRLVLSAKSEEDRARAEYERRVQEELRYETRRLEFEMMLHSNYFKQQERDQQQQPQLVMAPPPPPQQHPHAVVLHSPLGKKKQRMMEGVL